MTLVDSWPGYYGSVNLLSQQLPDASIIVTGGDDIFPDPNHDADAIRRQFYEHFPDGFGVMQPDGDDLYGSQSICPSPWMGGRWVHEAYGGKGPMCSEYSVWFGDKELRCVAMLMEAFWSRPDLCQRHNHWWRTGKRMAYQLRNEQLYWEKDKVMFNTRRAEGFPGHGRITR